MTTDIIVDKDVLIRIVAVSVRDAKQAHGDDLESPSVVKRIACSLYGYLLLHYEQVVEEIPHAKMQEMQKENEILRAKMITQAKVIKDLVEKCKKAGVIL